MLEMREIVMQLRTTIVITLCNAGCLVPGTLGDEPSETSSETTAVADDDDTGDDGHTSQTAGDASATPAATTAGESSDGGESTTGENPNALCEHEPSGLTPGTIDWEVDLVTWRGADLAVSSELVAIVGSSTIDGAWATFTPDGVNTNSGFWYPEGMTPMATVGRHVVALADGRFAAGFDVVDQVQCQWCAERWLVMFSSDGAIEWEQSLGEGSWAIAALPAGTIGVVDMTSADGLDFAATVHEIDVDGNVLRSVPTVPDEFEGPVSRAAAGPDGGIFAVGSRDPIDGGYVARWTNSFAFNWSYGGPWFHALASAANGDVFYTMGSEVFVPVTLERSIADGGIIWQAEIDTIPTDLATDCDDSVVVGSTTVSRHDGIDGTLQWSTPVDGTAVAVAVDQAGGVLALVDRDEGEGALIHLAGL